MEEDTGMEKDTGRHPPIPNIRQTPLIMKLKRLIMRAIPDELVQLFREVFRFLVGH